MGGAGGGAPAAAGDGGVRDGVRLARAVQLVDALYFLFGREGFAADLADVRREAPWLLPADPAPDR